MFNKTLLLVLCVVSNLSLTTCLQCSTCNDIWLSFTNASKLPMACEGKTVEAVACQAIFNMNYITKTIHLNLSSAEDPKRNNLLDLSVRNKFDDPKMIDGNITYICKTANDCAKQFYLSTIGKLIQNEPILNEIKGELYDPTVVNVQQCSNNQNEPIRCQNAYGCHGFEIIEDRRTDFEGECRNATTPTIFPRLYFQITLVQGDPKLSSDWNHLGFTCNKQNLCNTRQQIQKMVKLANEFYPWEFHPSN